MKILVGILHTIENEFEQCISAVEAQTHQDLEYFVIENLPNKEAHDTLYRTFMSKSDEVDFFAKVDADMVIEDKYLFEKVVQKFEEDGRIKQFKVPVYDYFTDDHVIGMHFFRNDVIWERETNEQVFVDDHPVNVLRENVKTLKAFKSSVLHCPDPSPFQSFHYGLHRGIKVRQGLFYKNDKKRVKQGRGHLESVYRLIGNYIKCGDNHFLWALNGSCLAIAGRFKKEHIPYSNPLAKKVFDKIIRNKTNYDLVKNGLGLFLLLHLKRPVLFKEYLLRKMNSAYISLAKIYRYMKRELSLAKD